MNKRNLAWLGAGALALLAGFGALQAGQVQGVDQLSQRELVQRLQRHGLDAHDDAQVRSHPRHALGQRADAGHIFETAVLVAPCDHVVGDSLGFGDFAGVVFGPVVAIDHHMALRA